MQLSYIEQSEAWGKFQAKVPGREKYWLINFANSSGNLDSALLIRQKLPAGKCWFWCPRGPVLKNYEDETAWNNFILEAKKIAVQEKALFIRVEAPMPSTTKIAWPTVFKKAHDHYMPEHSLVINLKAEEEAILAQMKPKGRYNIKLAEKKGVKIETIKEAEKGAQIFHQLMKITTQRDKFHGHSQSFYKNMLDILGKEKLVKLFVAKYEGKILAGLIATFYKNTATYYFGASSNEHRNLMAPYLLQWEAIKEAKKQGCTYYDLLGIAPKDAAKSHPWFGITKFKGKFGGQEIAYHPAKEYIVNKLLFKGIKAYKQLRKIL